MAFRRAKHGARLFQRGSVPSCRSETHQDCADRERSIVQRSGLAILCKARRADSELFRGRRWRGHGSDRFRGVEFRFKPAPRELRGGDRHKTLHACYVYFNTRTGTFEMTDYLRKLNKTKSSGLACAEPTDPIPSEADLKTRLDTLDRQLNKKYADVIAQSEKDRVSLVREAQRKWIKHRDEGAKLYASLFPPAERELRRLQFLGDVTAARIDTPTEEWENS